MQRYEIKGPLTDNELNKINQNYITLFNEYRKAGLNATEARDKAERALADALLAKNIAGGIDGKASEALSESKKATSTAGEAKQTADITREEMLAIIREQTSGADVVPELVQARQGKETLGENLNSIKQDVKWSEKKLSTLGNQKNDYSPINKAIVTFITDDGGLADYTIFKDVFSRHSVPCCTAVNTNTMVNKNPNYISIEQAQELQDVYGWEIMSHTHNHKNLNGLSEVEMERELTLSVDYLKANGINIKNFSYPYGGINELARKVVARHFRGARQSVFGSDGYNTFPIDTYGVRTVWLDKDVKLGPHDGYEINTFEYYKNLIDKANQNNAWLNISFHSGTTSQQGIVELIEQVVEYAANNAEVLTFDQALDKIGNIIEVGTSESEIERFALGVNGEYTSPYQFYETNKFDGNTPVSRFKKNVVSVNNVTHPIASNSGMPKEAGTLYTALYGDNNTQLYSHQMYVTVSNAMYRRTLRASGTWNPSWEKINNLTIKPQDFQAPNQHYLDYPMGITINNYSKDYAKSFNMPESDVTGGIFINHKHSDQEYGFNYQEYYVYGTGRMYRRTLRNTGYPGTWEQLDSFTIKPKNSYTPRTPLTDIPLGVTSSRIDGPTAIANDAPEPSAGVLTTYHYDKNEQGYNWQEYHVYGTSKVWKRSFNESGTPKDWERI